MRHLWHKWLADAPRPYVAFAAVSRRDARRLYRAQNVVWIWLGVAAVLSALAYAVRPALGPVLVTHSPALDVLRVTVFAVGGMLIAAGVWTVHRQVEAAGHVLFATGAVITAIVTTEGPGSVVLSVLLLVGLTLSSGFRAYFIVRWLGAPATG